MRTILAGLLSLTVASSARASDLSQALDLCQAMMGDSAVDGFEEYADYDEDQSLSHLLSPMVVPGQPPEIYDTASTGFIPRASFFEGIVPERRLTFEEVRRHVEDAARQTGLPVALLDAVIETESGYEARAVSPDGARGLMQLTPGMVRRLGVSDPLDPRENILGGARQLVELYQRFGSFELALAAYRAGPGSVLRFGAIPPDVETRRYVATVMARFKESLARRATE